MADIQQRRHPEQSDSESPDHLVDDLHTGRHIQLSGDADSHSPHHGLNVWCVFSRLFFWRLPAKHAECQRRLTSMGCPAHLHALKNEIPVTACQSRSASAGSSVSRDSLCTSPNRQRRSPTNSPLQLQRTARRSSQPAARGGDRRRSPPKNPDAARVGGKAHNPILHWRIGRARPMHTLRRAQVSLRSGHGIVRLSGPSRPERRPTRFENGNR